MAKLPPDIPINKLIMTQRDELIINVNPNESGISCASYDIKLSTDDRGHLTITLRGNIVYTETPPGYLININNIGG